MTIEYETANHTFAEAGVSTVVANSSFPRAISISLPENLADRIRKRLPNSDFASVDQYAAAVLESVLDELENLEGKTQALSRENQDGNEESQIGENAEVFSEEDQSGIEDRLRGLGYM